MREIKFRGRRVGSGEWVYGCLSLYSEAMSYITCDLLLNECFQVDHKTVGQYTGIKDKNGVEIYEGDILRESDSDLVFAVDWHDVFAGYIMPDEYDEEHVFMIGTICGYIEVIGNIHQNPELLESDIK